MTRHRRKKHEHHLASDTTSRGISQSEIREIIDKAKEIVISDECYPKELRQQLKESPSIVAQEFIERSQALFKVLESNSADLDKYYTTFMKVLPLNATRFFPHLKEPLAVLLTLKFGDCLLGYVRGVDKTPDHNNESEEFSLSAQENHALEYLVGYVLNNLYKKIKNSVFWSTKESQQAQRFLTSCRVTEEDNTQLLVTSLNRGGLWQGNSTVLRIFTITEEAFWKKTNKQVVDRIDGETMVQSLINDSRICGYFNILLEGCVDEVPKNVALNTLEQMLSLYIRVRSFSFAKSVTQRHKAELTQGKAKALRKEIKRSSEEVQAKDT